MNPRVGVVATGLAVLAWAACSSRFGSGPDAGRTGDADTGVPGGRTGVLAQFSPAEHAFLLINDHPDRDPDLIVRAQTQAARFLRSFFDEAAPTVVDPDAPRRLEAARGGGT